MVLKNAITKKKINNDYFCKKNMINPTTYIFDLDGTLLDTLQDLKASTNHALRSYGLPERTTEEVRQFVGNGVRKLIERAVPENTPQEVLEAVFADFRKHYMDHCLDATAPYPGIIDMLRRLKAQGKRMAIVSNKLDPAVKELNERFFKEYIDLAVGESDTVRRKPAPDMVNTILQTLGITKEEMVYVGDSEVDLQTARNAGVGCISVLWGFRDKEILIANGATTFAKTPEEIK